MPPKIAKKKKKTEEEIAAEEVAAHIEAMRVAEQALQLTLGSINKKIIGETKEKRISIARFNDLKAIKIPATPTGSISLDHAIGVGGYPRGRVIEIFGPESSGKTTLCLHAIAEAQKLGLVCAFIDVEHAFDPDYAMSLGVDLDKLIFIQPDNGDQAMEIVDQLVDSAQFAIIAIDSVAALVPRAEMEGDITDNHMGRQARLMSQALRRLVSKMNKTKTTLIFVNQIRMKIGVMFGNPETTSGGNALKFYSSVRLDIRRSTAIKKGDEVLGNITKVRVIKNKVARPFKTAFFSITHGKGIDKIAEVVDLAVDANIIDKNGSWYAYDTDRLGQGMDNVIELLTEHPDIYNSIRDKVLAAMNPKTKE